MLKLSKFKLDEGYCSELDSQLTLVETENLDSENKDKVLLELQGKNWHEDAMKFFVYSYDLLLNYFDGKTEDFCVVRNCEFSNYVWVIHGFNLKLSKVKFEKGKTFSQLNVLETENLGSENKDKVMLDLYDYDWSKLFSDNVNVKMKNFKDSYNLLLTHFDDKAEDFCVVRNCVDNNYFWVIHV